MAFSHGGKHLASGFGDGTVRLWDAEGTAVEDFTMESKVDHLSFSRDGRLLETDRGNINIDFVDKNNQPLACSPSFGTMENAWVVYGTQRLLWLPVDFRPERIYGRCDSITIIDRSRQLTIIQFDPNALPAGKLPD